VVRPVLRTVHYNGGDILVNQLVNPVDRFVLVVWRLEATNVEMKMTVHDPKAGSRKSTVMSWLINVPPNIGASLMITQELEK
jgi:hypothetical protein